jgi:two-component system, LytTR family, sensor kinase
MKRVLLHILFWICFWLIISSIEFLWVRTMLKDLTEFQLFVKSVSASLFYILPHTGFAYYVVYAGIPAIVKNRKKMVPVVLVILLLYVADVFMVRSISHYFVTPYIYGNNVPQTIAVFDPRRLFGIMVQTVFPLGVMIAIKSVKNQLQSKEREKNLIREKLSTELKLLRNQLNPHFLFNTLNNIYALTRKKSDIAPEVVMKLSELLSFMLYESGKESITISKEVEFLEDYISLERIRYNDRLTINFNKEIDEPSQLITPLLLLPLVENAFKHGASENRFDSFIYIHIAVRKGVLDFCIKNSFEENKGKVNGASIGLNSTRRQLELMYREQTIEVSNMNNVFKVKINVNLNSYGKI